MSHRHPSHGKKQAPLVDRIQAALVAAGGNMKFHDLACELYPDPASHRYQSNGGPPGCYMALGAGIRRGGFSEQFIKGEGWSSRVIWSKSPVEIDRLNAEQVS